MNIKASPHSRKAGYALMIVLIMATISMVILGATMKRMGTTAILNERENQYNQTFYAAEAAVEKVVRRMMADYQQGQVSLLSNNSSLYPLMYPNSSDDAYWSGFQFANGQGTANRTYVFKIVEGVTNFVDLTSQFAGLSGWQSIYRVVSNVKKNNSRYNITNACQQDMELDAIPVFQFAIFYNSALEFTWAAPFTINGRVHANGPIYTGVSSSSSLTFNDLVTTTSTKSKKSLGGYVTGNMTGPESYNYRGNGNTNGYTTNVTSLTLPIGTNNASDTLIHKLIEIPPAGEDVNSDIGELRYYNKAGLVLIVSNNTVTGIFKSSANDPSPTTITANYSSTNYSSVSSNFPFLNLTNTFTDQRENKTVKATQLDMYRLKTWATTNSTITSKRPSDNPFGVLFVADNRTVTSSQLDAIRLVNGTNLPSFGTGSGIGFTVATPNPIYVLGNYNLLNSAHAGTTNTSQTVPASVISDALTILSSAWSDSLSSGSYSSRDPNDITINAAILTGIVRSTGTDSTTFSGGVHNLPRLLEDWSGASKTVTLNTSIVNFFNSQYATNQFRLPGDYYSAPTRKFSFDVNFRDPAKQPPGTPMVGAFKRNKWSIPPPNTVTYAGP